VKQAVLYQMLGGVDRYAADGSYQRGFFSILIIGDPSTGKTTLLMYVARLVPRAHYSSAVSSSGKGLTVLIGKDENGVMELRVGAVVLANGSIVCIDEIEKMRADDRVSMHECMETGKCTVNKGGFNTELNAHTGTLAAGNPTLGRYDPFKNVTENINLPVTLLSRFDLIFIIRDMPDPESDGKIVDRLLAAHRGMPLVEEGHDFYEHEFLRKYIIYARRLKPKLTDEAAKQIKEFYLEIRKKSDNEDSPFTLATRQGQALIRLAAARAKLHLREEITKEDVVTVWALMTQSLQESGMDTETGKMDIDTIMTGTPTSARSKMELILSTVAKLEKENDVADELEVYKRLQPQLTEYEVRDALQKLTRDGVLFNPKPGYIKRAKF
jgi:replicative DNA helicase Mcm